MSDRDILNCGASHGVMFGFRCPMQWDSLTPTGDPRKRHCSECDRPVYWCHDANEAGIRAEQGECIAVPDWLAEGARDHVRERPITIGRSATEREILAMVAESRVKGE